MRKYLLSLFIALFAACFAFAQTSFAQTKMTGKVIDANTQEELIGATILVKGTTTATTTSLDGSFKLNVPAGNQTLVISYIGYISQEITVDPGKASLGTISLQSSSSNIKEVTINGDVAIDRKTPVAVSTLSAQFIEEKVGNQDIPQLLSVTPGVMATAQGGGYGDSRISIRGFSSASGQGNVALTINGIPVNDMENGAIFWSDFSGLTDVMTSLQTQRGLGATKIIVPSFGGTINIQTRNTDALPGGYVSQGIGSNGYEKTAALISTGLDKNGWALTVLGSRTQGAFPFDDSKYLGYNYFFNVSKVISSRQTLSFSIMGASQTHGQRPQESIAMYQAAPQGIMWNYQNSIKDGQQFAAYNNFFSKPVLIINHDWTINDKASLSTVLYGTYGNGGAGAIGGAAAPRVGGTNIYTPFDYTAVEKTNAVSPDGSAGTYLYASHNDHIEYGIRSTYKTKIGSNIDLSVGADVRYYTGNHYKVVTDVLGADYVTDNFTSAAAVGSRSGDINTPVKRALVGDKIGFYNKDDVQTAGVFSQAEYSKNDFSVFVTLSGSGTGNRRTDFFNYLNTDPNQTTRWVNSFTYQAKGGANYNIDEHMNIYANVGMITKPPFFDKGIFQNFTNQINPNPINEKLFSYELGYGYKTSGFSAKVDLYRSQYKDQTLTSNFTDNAGNIFTGNVTGVNSLYQGVEVSLRYQPIRIVTFSLMGSVADWHYTNNPGPATIFDANQNPVKTITQAFLKNMKIGDAAQTTAHGGIDIDVTSQVRIGGDYFYWGNYYSKFTPANITTAGLQGYKIPDYSNVNLNASFKFKMAGLDAQLNANVMNLLNTKYISDAFDASASGLAQNVNVYYGLLRTFTTGLKVKF